MSATARQLFFEDTGTKGETLILVHGLGGTTNTWYPQVRALKADFRILSYDFAGSGRSPVHDNITIESHVQDLLEVIAEAGAPRVHLAGHSMGTIICMHAAAIAPEKIASRARTERYAQRCGGGG